MLKPPFSFDEIMAPLGAEREPPAHIPRLGLLLFGELPGPLVAAFRRALQDRGYVDNHTLIIE